MRDKVSDETVESRFVEFILDADERAAESERYWRWRSERDRRETPWQRDRREGMEHDMALWEGDAG